MQLPKALIWPPMSFAEQFEKSSAALEDPLWIDEHMIGPLPLQLTPGQTGDWLSWLALRLWPISCAVRRRREALPETSCEMP